MAAAPATGDRRRMRTSDAPVMTAAEYTARERELRDLRELRERELPELMREARTLVAADAAEEISQIQQNQTVLDARISALEDLLHDVLVLPDDDSTELVTVGRAIDVEYLRTGRTVTLLVAGSGGLTDMATVSARSPVGRAVMGRRVGDVVAAELPGGWLEELRVAAIRLPV
jgi:transcription elongation factor GreA